AEPLGFEEPRQTRRREAPVIVWYVVPASREWHREQEPATRPQRSPGLAEKPRRVRHMFESLRRQDQVECRVRHGPAIAFVIASVGDLVAKAFTGIRPVDCRVARPGWQQTSVWLRAAADVQHVSLAVRQKRRQVAPDRAGLQVELAAEPCKGSPEPVAP